MSIKRHSTEAIVNKLRQMDVELGLGHERRQTIAVDEAWSASAGSGLKVPALA